MVFDFYTKKIKVFVAEVNDDVLELREHLIKVLGRAGMEVLYTKNPNPESHFEDNQSDSHLIHQADCSVHLLGTSLDNRLNTHQGQKTASEQLAEARKRNTNEWRDFKIFIWHPSHYVDEENSESDEFISAIRQGIMPNMIYSNRNSVVSFVEDIRSVMFGGKPADFDTEATDIFFIYNMLDQDSAMEIISFLEDVSKLKKLEIVISADIDYSELIVQQSKKSKMLVIYFKNTSAWALPFVQQVWKLSGGASSKTPILFIGDDNVPVNQSVDFDAEMVTSKLVSQEIIPIEIKVQLDKLIE